MKKKNKLIILLFLLISLIVICKKILVFNSINYNITVDSQKIQIKETYNNSYYIELKTHNNTYPFRIYKNMNNKRKIVKDIYLYSDNNIECILPVIDGKLYTDVMCYRDNILYDYHTLVGENQKLDAYISNIKLYDLTKFDNEFNNIKNIGTIEYYELDNFDKNIAITTYKGLLINGEKINLFDKDIYRNDISLFIDNYYVTADYENDYSFNYFYIINLNNKEIKKIKSKEEISYDSYIQGTVNKKIYLYDKDNENQYEIDIEHSIINLVSSKNYIKYYNNKKWERMNKIKANKEIYFNYETLENNYSNYDYVKEATDYYYLFKTDGIYYKLYRVDKNSINTYKFILNIPVTNIYFNENYIYYIYKNKLFYYSDNIGLKTLLKDSELQFNNTIKYYIY